MKQIVIVNRDNYVTKKRIFQLALYQRSENEPKFLYTVYECFENSFINILQVLFEKKLSLKLLMIYVHSRWGNYGTKFSIAKVMD